MEENVSAKKAYGDDKKENLFFLQRNKREEDLHQMSLLQMYLSLESFFKTL